jgi:hypothetical protein
MINTNLLYTTNQYFAKFDSLDYVVKPSIPILYFGDETAYRNSSLKIITVGKNPSLNEFFNPLTESYEIAYRFPNWNGKNLTRVLNEYFKKRPLKSWFSSFEPILNGLNCSYYSDNQFNSTALHTDICSPIATNPTWSNLSSNQRQLLFKHGINIWHDLVKDLAPDIILVSIPAKLFLSNISLILGRPIHKVLRKANGDNRKYPYLIYSQILEINKKMTNIVFGQAANKPFDTITNPEKFKIGETILCQV